MSSRHIVITIVIGILAKIINLLGETSPLQPIARTLDKSRSTTRRVLILQFGITFALDGNTGDITHTATKLHRVGRYHTAMPVRRTITQCHTSRRLIDSLSEAECAEIDPRTATHLLIDRKLGRSTQMVHRIERIISAIALALIRHIDCIFALLGDCRSPYDTTLVGTLFHTLRTTIRTLGKGILRLGIDVTTSRKTAFCTRVPGAIARIFVIDRLGSHIIIDNYFGLLHITLAWQHHICTRIFEHRHQIGHHVTLRIEVLDRLPQTRSLPTPLSTTIIEHIAVALPHCNMTARQTALRLRMR